MILFCRNTHDENGNFREELRSLDLDIGNSLMGLGVHALRKEGNTLEEFIKYHKEYHEQFKEENYLPTIAELLTDLATMIQKDTVKVKVLNENPVS